VDHVPITFLNPTGDFFVSYGAICCFISLAIVCWSIAFVDAIFVPHQKVGVLWRAVITMVFDDLMVWYVLYVTCFVTFGAALMIAFPVDLEGYSTGSYVIDAVPAFNHPLSMLVSLIHLSLLGTELSLDLVRVDSQTGSFVLHPYLTAASNVELATFTLFLILYLVFILLTVILLLNLLIAMMSSTYERIMEHSELQWRVDFARVVLKTELECTWLSKRPFRLFELQSGERGTAPNERDKHFFIFRHVAPNKEGQGSETSMFDETTSSTIADDSTPGPQMLALED